MRPTTPADHDEARRPRLRLIAAGLAAAAVAAGAALAVAASGAGEVGASAVDPANLSVSKADSPDPVVENAVLTYTLRVENGGPDPATNITVTDDLPSQVDPSSANPSAGNCDIRGRKVDCELGTLANGAAATVTIQVRPKKAGQITNEASVDSDVADPVGANNEDSETTTVVEAPRGPTCKKKPATIQGTEAGETLTGTAGRDVIVARGGGDQVRARSGKDLVCAGGGNDKIRSGGGNDFVKGQRGRDKAKGQRGGDTLRGNRGRDNLKGGRGNDLLAGGKGRDRCKGGRGNDVLRSC